VRQDVLGYLNDRGLAPAVLAPQMLAELVGLVTDGTISRGQAKDVLNESMTEEKWPHDIVKARGLAQVSDAGELGAVVEAVLAANPSTVEEYRAAGDDKVRKNKRNALMGLVMRELKGKGNAQIVNELLDTHLT
jgi:aspartyl-tRNA(Asn)/glutamyl-tRNA(Gln) amidotransferase subunit B